MLVAIIGESCVGKTTLANFLKEKINAEIYTGRDYLRLEKNPTLALEKFKQILNYEVVNRNVIYVISEKEHLSLLPNNCFRIVLTADLEIIKNRFKLRMNGNLPKPVEIMLEKKHGVFDEIKCDIKIHNGNYQGNDIFNLIDNLAYQH